MKKVKALVLTGFGINCEEEMAAAYRMAGAEATIIHFNEVLIKGHSIHDYDVLNFPGGFSFGDDLSSGKVMANKIRYKRLPNGKTLLDEIRTFLQEGKYILGVCNGFQMLVRLGLLPNTAIQFEQEATLSANNS
ncbi:MAG: phosphoribosylformylglycinamidine synthase subunit PurQ, partial [Saprospiraceae bacterium]|nr:phosphoribosylformylglycinamidine synthase subunit PurQ [Saprospiraceae bacterium]